MRWTWLFCCVWVLAIGGCGRTDLELDPPPHRGTDTGSSSGTDTSPDTETDTIDPDTATAGDPICGDLSCDPSESCSTCPLDCGPCSVCGDDLCNDEENCESCPGDCGECPSCGNDVCEPNLLES